MENAARNATAANPRAMYGRVVGAGTSSTVRGGLSSEEDAAGGIGKINCTYPIDFNPWTLSTRLRILSFTNGERSKLTSILLGSS